MKMNVRGQLRGVQSTKLRTLRKAWVTTTRAIGPEKLINDALPRPVYAKDRNLSEFIQLQAKPPKNPIYSRSWKEVPVVFRRVWLFVAEPSREI